MLASVLTAFTHHIFTKRTSFAKIIKKCAHIGASFHVLFLPAMISVIILQYAGCCKLVGAFNDQCVNLTVVANF